MNRDDLFLMKLSQNRHDGHWFLGHLGVYSASLSTKTPPIRTFGALRGGLASFLVSIGLIELQSKKNGYRLKDIQNYFLGIAFFFSTVGVLWGTRFMMGYATGTLNWIGSVHPMLTPKWIGPRMPTAFTLKQPPVFS